MDRDPFAPGKSLLLGVGLGLLACTLSACSHDWDAYDPRLGAVAATSGASSSSSSGAGGSAGQGGAGGAGQGGGGEAPVPCGPSGVASLEDTFDDGMIGKEWLSGTQHNAAIAESAGEIVISIPAAIGADAYADLYSAKPYDLSNCQVFVKAAKVPSGSTGYAHLWYDQGDGGKIQIFEQGGALKFTEEVPGDPMFFKKTIVYDANAHAYWRIRASNGVVHWDTSPDGKSWTPQASKTSPLPLVKVYFGVGAGDGTAEMTAESAHFDNMDIVP